MGDKHCGRLKVELHNGLKMPAIGIDTGHVQTYEEVHSLVDTALRSGYLLFNAVSEVRSGRQNEQHLGTALQTLLPVHNLEREDIFVSTSLNMTYSTKPEQCYQFLQKTFQTSLEQLGLDYVDMYMLNFPEEETSSEANPKHSLIRTASWKALSRLHEDGNISSIGLINFTDAQVSDLIGNHCRAPMLNRVQFHPLRRQEQLVKYCNSQCIRLQSCSVFGGLLSGSNVLIDHPVVKEIAFEHNANATQVLLAWALQQEVAVIPKAIKPEHIRDNIEITFQLTHRNMLALNNLKLPQRNRHMLFH